MSVVSDNIANDRLRVLALDGVFWRTVHLTTPIFPLRVMNADKTVARERTPFEDGWNKCHRDCSERVDRIKSWIKALPDTYRSRVEELLLRNVIGLQVRDGRVSMDVDCSDLFFWGCADGEEIELSELDSLTECFALTRFGGELWVCRKRNMRPQSACYEGYLPKVDHALFDAAGPERNDPDGRRTS